MEYQKPSYLFWTRGNISLCFEPELERKTFLCFELGRRITLFTCAKRDLWFSRGMEDLFGSLPNARVVPRIHLCGQKNPDKPDLPEKSHNQFLSRNDCTRVNLHRRCGPGLRTNRRIIAPMHYGGRRGFVVKWHICLACAICFDTWLLEWDPLVNVVVRVQKRI